MIEGKHIFKSYGNKHLFNDFSFHINDQDFICFVGESGRGKTTLLNMIGLLDSPTSGQILHDGKEFKTNQDKISFFRYHVGFIFQNFALVEAKTVEQNLRFVQKKCSNNISIRDALAKVGLDGCENEKIYKLSGGEQQRVALARLYIKECKIVLADEPTGSLDYHNAEIVLKILKDLNNQGKTIILVTHDDRIKKQCNRIIEL